VNDLPPLPPKLSIARAMIDEYVDEFAGRYKDSPEEAPKTPG
jgi:hypothetical protein